MKYIFIIFLCVISIMPCLSQGKNDSIKIEESKRKIDTYWNEDDYVKAQREIQYIIPLIYHKYGSDSNEYADFLEIIAQIYSDSGDIQRALSTINECLKIRSVNLGENNTKYASALSNKALFLSQDGNFTQAMICYDESLNIFNNLKTYSLEFARSLKDRAITFYDLGDFESSKLDVEKAYDMVQTINVPDTLSDFISIELAYAAIISEFDNDKAITIYKHILGKIEFSSHKFQMISAYEHLSICYYEQENYTECIENALKAESLLLSINEKDNFNMGTIKMYIGMGYMKLRKYIEAEVYFKASLAIRESTCGYSHPYTIGVLSRLLYLFNETHQSVNAIETILTITEREHDSVISTFTQLDSDLQDKYWTSRHSNWYLRQLTQYCDKFKDPSINEITFNGLLLSKNILLESNTKFIQSLKQNPDPSFLRRYEVIQTLRENQYRNQKDSIAILERALRKDYLEDTDYMTNFRVSWKDIRSKLDSHSVAIEFLSFPLKNGNIQYGALSVCKEDRYPHYTPLFKSNELVNINPSRYYTTTILSDKIWKPLLEIINNKEVVYFSPIGELYNISIENLPLPNGKGYMSDVWNIYRLSSTRNILDNKNRNFILSAALFGDMDYNLKTELDQEIEQSDANREYLSPSKFRNGFQYLPGTKYEIENAETALKKFNIGIEKFSGANATKESILSFTGHAPSILHIATHGFCYSTGNSSKPKTIENDEEDEDEILRKSGLVFSGVNNSIKATKDGIKNSHSILTAYEVSKLDFWHLDLVVLSACQTGLGEIREDGVFGLQRGFKMAGANSLMMSLWKVDDEATQLLMSNFYNNYASGFSKQEALKEAQNKVRNFKGTINGHYRIFSHPKYWAAFILLDGLN